MQLFVAPCLAYDFSNPLQLGKAVKMIVLDRSQYPFRDSWINNLLHEIRPVLSCS
jgi:hypothetical protein